MSLTQIPKSKFDSIYDKGFKWCRNCSEKKLTDNLICPDCKQRLRFKARRPRK